jgi:NAD(P) transhydrogenase subunit alpha
VEAYDVRPAVKEQIEASGAKFVELPSRPAAARTRAATAKAMDEKFYAKQRETMARSRRLRATWSSPRRPYPARRARRPDHHGDGRRHAGLGSVIVDVAAEQGGNCELTRPRETVVRGGVTILGP